MNVAALAHDDVVQRVLALNQRYAQALDDDRLEDWPRFFTENGAYIIHPRENLEQGLEGYWMYCDSRRMLEDRVLSLREVNLFNAHYDRHFLSNGHVESRQGGVYVVRTNYMVVQTDASGRSSIYSVGEYRDEIVLDGAEPKFRRKVVVPDTYMVSTLLAIPL